MKEKTINGLGVLLFLVAGDTAVANDEFAPAPGRPQVSVSDMQVFPNGPDVVGVSVLTRYMPYVDAKISTTGLAANGAYSWWWVVFNRPEFCVDGCGLDDLPVGATPISNGDPRVQASLLWGTGFVSDGTGAAEVTAHLDRSKPPGEVRFGPGLRRPRHADIHVALRSHGPAVAGEAAEQVASFDGGCTAEEIAAMMCPNTNVQFSVHTP